MPDKDVAAISFGEDRYSWLVVPKSFDVVQFCKLTGLAAETGEVVAPPMPENFTEAYKQKEKLFFVPSMIYVAKDGTGYNILNQFWAGRVLPGQTIREGIATELLQELTYKGHFGYRYERLLDTTQDRKGRDIKRYLITIYLYDDTFKNKVAGGADIKLQKIQGQQFEYPADPLTP